jgi:signal transduction histidine kinase
MKLNNKSVSILLFASILIYIIVGVFVVLNIKSLVSRSSDITKSTEIYENIMEFRTSLKTSIIEQRNFLLSNDPASLKKYKTLKKGAYKELVELRIVLNNNHEKTEIIDKIDSLTDLEYEYMEKMIRLRGSDIDSVVSAIFINGTYSSYETIKQLSDSVATVQKDWFGLLRVKSERSSTNLSIFLLISFIVVFFLTIFSFLMLRKENKMRIEAEKNVQSQIKELMVLNQTKDKLFSIIAHDLRSPFNGVLGLSSLLIKEYEVLTEEKKKKFILNIHQTSEQTFKLLENLLEWAQSQTGMISNNPIELSLSEITQNVVESLTGNIKLKDITVHLHDTEMSVIADENMLKTILRNLISNSIKYTYPGGEINISAEKTGNSIEICVADNGIGIEPEIIPTLFSSNLNRSKNGTENERGTGLGLMVCKEFVLKNGGNIRVESKVNKGSRFIFTLPPAQPNNEKTFLQI